MRTRKTRLAVVGVLALAITVTVGLLSGGVADAKKKKSKRSFTVTKSTPATVPAATPTADGVAKIPIGDVGGKATKGKVISLNGVNVISTFSGPAGFAGDVDEVDVIGPSGREGFLLNPIPNSTGGGSTETSSGPLTETPNSSVGICIPTPAPPPPPCADPDATLGPPYAGTVRNQSLLNFTGSNPRGTWFLKVFNGGTQPFTVNSVSVTGGLITKPQ